VQRRLRCEDWAPLLPELLKFAEGAIARGARVGMKPGGRGAPATGLLRKQTAKYPGLH
jgi:hypothetical protein